MYKISRFVVQPVAENQFQPVMRQQQEKENAISDLFGDSQPFIVPKPPVSTRVARHHATTRITIPDSALNNHVCPISKNEKRSGLDILIFIVVLIILGVLVISVKKLFDN